MTHNNVIVDNIFLSTERQKRGRLCEGISRELRMAGLKIAIFRTVAQSSFIARLPRFVSWSQGRLPEETISKRWGPVFESRHVQKGKMWLERCSPIMSCLCGVPAQRRPAQSSRIARGSNLGIFTISHCRSARRIVVGSANVLESSESLANISGYSTVNFHINIRDCRNGFPQIFLLN